MVLSFFKIIGKMFLIMVSLSLYRAQLIVYPREKNHFINQLSR